MSVKVSVGAVDNYEGLSGYTREVGCVDGGRAGEVAIGSPVVFSFRGGLPRGSASRSFSSLAASFAFHVDSNTSFASWGLGKVCSPFFPTMVLFGSSTNAAIAELFGKV